MTGPGIIPDYVISTPDHLLNFTRADELVYWGMRPRRKLVKPYDQFPAEATIDGPEDAGLISGLGYRAANPLQPWWPGNYFMIGTVQFHWDAVGAQWVEGRVPEVLINFINPSHVPVGTGLLDLVVTGSNFTTATVVEADGLAVPTMFLSRNQVNATLTYPSVPGIIVIGTNDSYVDQDKQLAVTPVRTEDANAHAQEIRRVRELISAGSSAGAR
jgi:hypothetical protein